MYGRRKACPSRAYRPGFFFVSHCLSLSAPNTFGRSYLSQIMPSVILGQGLDFSSTSIKIFARFFKSVFACTPIFLYNIIGFVRLRWWWSSFPSIRPVIRSVIHPSKFLILEEEDDGRGRGKTLVVLQFAKSYKLILKN